MALDPISLLQQAGFKGDALRTAWAIARRESGFRPDAFNGNRGTGDQSYGLFQVNMLGELGSSRRRQFGLQRNEDLFDPLTNARAAYRLSKGGTDFGAWGVGPNAYRETPPLDFSGFPGSAPRIPSSRAQRAASAVPPEISRYVEAAIGKKQPASQKAADPAIQAYVQRAVGKKAGVSSYVERAVGHPVEPPPLDAHDREHAEASFVKGILRPGTSWRGTHVTDGLDWNGGQKTAVDIMAKAGTPVGAPEDGTVVKWGSAQGGQALYFKARSGRLYWLGHIDDRLPVGTRVKKGGVIARISGDHAAPHLHIDYKL